MVLGNSQRFSQDDGQINTYYSYSLTQSPVFDPSTGFGGFESDKAGCLTSGPFASYVINLPSGTLPAGHCLKRHFSNTVVQYLTAEQVANTTKQPSFELFRIELEGVPGISWKIHSSGHHVIGGEMGDRYSSPGGERLRQARRP